MKRKDLNTWAGIASNQAQPSLVPKQSNRIRVIDLPGVRDLEDFLLLHSGDEFQTREHVDRLCRQLFGVTPDETEYEAISQYWQCPDGSPEQLRIAKKWEAHEEQYETPDSLTDDET